MIPIYKPIKQINNSTVKKLLNEIESAFMGTVPPARLLSSSISFQEAFKGGLALEIFMEKLLELMRVGCALNKLQSQVPTQCKKTKILKRLHGRKEQLRSQTELSSNL